MRKFNSDIFKANFIKSFSFYLDKNDLSILEKEISNMDNELFMLSYIKNRKPSVIQLNKNNNIIILYTEKDIEEVSNLLEAFFQFEFIKLAVEIVINVFEELNYFYRVNVKEVVL